MALLLAAPLLTPMAPAQTTDLRSETSPSAAVVAAHCRYTPSDTSCAEPPGSRPGNPGADNATLAQGSRQIPGLPPWQRRLPMAHPRVYAGFANEPSGRHMLIGALVGFGLGAAVGAKGNRDQHPGVETKAIILGGSIGGLLGAAVGAAVPSFHSRSRYQHGPWPDDKEQASRRDQGSLPARSEPLAAPAHLNSSGVSRMVTKVDDLGREPSK